MPFFTSAVAIPAPIPELAPVTKATRPDQRSISVHFHKPRPVKYRIIYNFREFYFRESEKIAKRAKVIGLKSFRLYGS